MAAAAWKAYDIFRVRLGEAAYNMETDTFKCALFLSTSDAATLTTVNSDLADLTNQHANANGYTTGGTTIGAVTYDASVATVTWDAATDPSWTATGGSIVARFAVIYDDTHATDGLVCMTTLDATPADVTVTDGNTLTIAFHASGIFTLTGMT
jgi:hypothetical protein